MKIIALPVTLTMNRDSYNKIAQDLSNARTNLSKRERDYVDLLLEAAPTDAIILDLGCGTGRPITEYVLSKGRKIVEIDQSEAMINFVAERS